MITTIQSIMTAATGRSMILLKIVRLMDAVCRYYFLFAEFTDPMIVRSGWFIAGLPPLHNECLSNEQHNARRVQVDAGSEWRWPSWQVRSSANDICAMIENSWGLRNKLTWWGAGEIKKKKKNISLARSAASWSGSALIESWSNCGQLISGPRHLVSQDSLGLRIRTPLQLI